MVYLCLPAHSLSTWFNSSSFDDFLFLRCSSVIQPTLLRAQVLVVHRDGSFGLPTRRFGSTLTQARTHTNKRREKEKVVIVALSEIDLLGATVRQEELDPLRFGGLDGGSERSKLDCRIASDSHREALLGLASGNGVVVNGSTR